ncbi:class I glutamine amidotransferase-like protein [Sanghuangporus baumii]|uniref:Class I glutamine amidotransferase-like protein n=1 Tax=Sanghuangporus baumii TaxID=108892 RepID=A0A9Q5MYN6_SANBA|nr:class I glutamine amidotransferase-like protein [Sanghuangporus baumii]
MSNPRPILSAFLLIVRLIMASMTFRGAAAQQQSTAHILLYTATADFRHDSIPTAIQALQNQSVSNGGSFNVRFDATEDRTRFTDDTLAGYDAVMFVSTTGEVLDASGKTALRNYLDKGGNFVAVHSASDTLRNDSWFGEEVVLDASGKTALRNYLDKGGNFIAVHSASDTLRNDSWFGEEVGAFFDYHPVLQNATVDVLDPSHPSTSMLPAEWHVQDEMYNFKSDPRSVGAVVILSANESSYVGKSSDFFLNDGQRNFDQGTPHPTAWYQERGAGIEEGGFAGRSFYTSLGHLNETWMRSSLMLFFYPGADELFIAHVMGGVTWALESSTTKAFNSSGLVGNPGNDTSDPSVSSTTSNSASGSASTSGDISSFKTVSMTVLLVAVITGLTLAMIRRSL